jgi:dihydrolipoamide dehydrogenase
MVAEILADKPHIIIIWFQVLFILQKWLVGQTEEQLKASGVEFKSGSFPLKH